MNPLLTDAVAAAIHSPDAEIRLMVDLSVQALEQVPRHLETWQAALAQNRTLADCLQLDADQIELCRHRARSLCDQGDFLLALPLAMYCAAFASDNPEHSFLAGACLQRLGQAASAAHFYRVALQLDGTDAASAYRLGECLEVVGQREEASHLYQWAIELARGNFALRTLQDMASCRLARLQSARRP
jgi:tetratricopeptide (TPR) repeat protein